jgi:hypothetical protein
MKIGALVSVSVRRIKVAMASGCPAAAVWGAAALRLNAAASARLLSLPAGGQDGFRLGPLPD